MNKQRFAKILKYGAIVLGVYAVGAWTADWLMDGDLKWGVIDRSGKMVVPLRYEAMGEARNGVVPVRRPNEKDDEKYDEKWGLMDASGKVLLEPQHSLITWSGSGWKLSHHPSGVPMNTRTGWADPSGKLVLAPEYQAVVGGGIAVKKNDTWTLRDERGAVVATGAFSSLTEFKHGLAAAGSGKNLGVVDRKGQWLITPRFARVIICGSNCVLGLDAKEWRFYDRHGKQLPGPAYPTVMELGHDFFRVTSAAKKSAIVSTGRGRVVEMPFQDMRAFNGERAAFKADSKWGYLDASGNVAVKAAYDDARAFYDGVAPVQAGKSWHLIDASGKRIGAQDYEDVGEFRRGFALVQTAGSEAYVDKSGRAVFAVGDNWIRLLDASGKPVGHRVLFGRNRPVLLSAETIGVADYPAHVRWAASVFSFGSDGLTGELGLLGNWSAILAVACLIGVFLLGPAPAARFKGGVMSVVALAGGPRMRVVARKAGKGLAYLALLVVGLLLLLVAINLFDEKLDPEVAAYLKQDPPKLPADARNGYFHFVGLAAKGDPHAAGMKYVAGLHEAQEKRLKGEKLDWPKFDTLSLSDPRICATDNAPCLSIVAAGERDARRIVADHQLLLERYRALLEYPEYAETRQPSTWDAPLMSFQPLTYAQRVFFVAAALKVHDGQAEAALADVEKSLAFSRRMLAGSRTLIGRFVAAAQVQRSALFMSEILQARRGSLATSAARLDRSLRPLSDDERRLAESVRFEFGSSTSLASSAGCKRGDLSRMGDDPPLLMTLPCLFLQENATINRLYFTSYKPFLALDAAPAREFEKMQSERRPAKSDFPTVDAIYNPFGKAIVALGTADWSAYTASMHDRDAILRLVAAQALIVARRASNAEVPKVLAQAGSRYHDPYTGEPMRWDAARGELYFEPKSERVKRFATEGRLAVKL